MSRENIENDEGERSSSRHELLEYEVVFAV